MTKSKKTKIKQRRKFRVGTKKMWFDIHNRNGYPTKTGAKKVANAIRDYREGNLARIHKAPKGHKNRWLVYANRRGQK